MRNDKQVAKAAGVPTWLRRYSQRYGKGVFHLLQEAKKYRDVPTLDHWRDRRVAAQALVLALQSGLPPREIVEGIIHA